MTKSRIWMTVGVCIWISGASPQAPQLAEYYMTMPTALQNYKAQLRAENRRRNFEIQRYVTIMNSFVFEHPGDTVLTSIAEAVYDDSVLTGIPGEFYLALMRVENPWLDPWIENWYGAVGITQVVPRYWDGVYPECGEDLRRDIYTQVCYGARIYLHYLDSWRGNDTLALYAYNGCTPELREGLARCVNYPRWIQDYTVAYSEIQ